MLRDWQEIDSLVVTGGERIDAPPSTAEETPRQRKIREKQEKHFGFPMRDPPLKVTIHCESIDPKPDLSGHQCSDELSDIVRHGPRYLAVRDRRVENAPTFLRIKRVRWLCRACGKTFSEVLPDIHEGHRITKRFHRDLAIASLNRPFAEVANRNSVKAGLVETIFHEYQNTMMKAYQADLPRVLAVDETKLLNDVWFVCSDLEAGRIIDITFDKRYAIEDCLKNHSYKGSVEVWVQDMSTKYRSIARDIFPQADIVVDRFHVIQNLTKAVDKVRGAFASRLPKHLRSALAQDMKVLDYKSILSYPATSSSPKRNKGAQPTNQAGAPPEGRILGYLFVQLPD